MPNVSTETHRDPAPVGETDVWVVTRSARDGLVFGQNGVVEELAAQRDGPHGRGIVRRDGDRRQPQRGPDSDNRTDRPVITRGSTSNAKNQQPGDQNVM